MCCGTVLGVGDIYCHKCGIPQKDDVVKAEMLLVDSLPESLEILTSNKESKQRYFNLMKTRALELQKIAPRGIRTPDLVITNHSLFQLSYRGKWSVSIFVLELHGSSHKPRDSYRFVKDFKGFDLKEYLEAFDGVPLIKEKTNNKHTINILTFRCRIACHHNILFINAYCLSSNTNLKESVK